MKVHKDIFVKNNLLKVATEPVNMVNQFYARKKANINFVEIGVLNMNIALKKM